jgi:hypothetical protein
MPPSLGFAQKIKISFSQPVILSLSKDQLPADKRMTGDGGYLLEADPSTGSG